MAIHFVSLGTSAPPATVGGYTMSAFSDARSIPNPVTTVPLPSPFVGSMSLGQTLTHTEVGSGWATWSHSYTGDVYYLPAFSPTPYSITLTMPANCAAFYGYAEPDAFSTYAVSATANDGTTSGNIPVAGQYGAHGFAFYADAGGVITSVTFLCPSDGGTFPSGLAIGEFGIAAGAGPGDTGITFSKTTSIDDPRSEFTISYGTGVTTLGTFTLVGGASATFVGLDDGVTYWATEVPAMGWEQSAVVVSDGTVDAIIVTEGEIATVEFQNAPVPFVGPTTTQRRLIRRMRRSPHVANQGQWSFISNFELWMDTGVGLSSSLGQGADPQVHLRVSKDGGQTWGQYRAISVGKLGEYRKRVMWWQLGQGRDWVFEVTCSDPVAWSLVQAYIDIEPGVS